MTTPRYSGFVPDYDSSPQEWVYEHMAGWYQDRAQAQAAESVWEEDLDFQEYVRTSRDPGAAADLWPDVQRVYSAIGKALGTLPGATPEMAEKWDEGVRGGFPAYEAAYTDYDRRAQAYAREVERVYYANRESLPSDWILSQDPDDLRMLSVPGFQEAAQYIEQAGELAQQRVEDMARYNEVLEARIKQAEQAKEDAVRKPHNLGEAFLNLVDAVPGFYDRFPATAFALTDEERAAIEQQVMDEMAGLTAAPDDGSPKPPELPVFERGEGGRSRAEVMEEYEHDYRIYLDRLREWRQGKSIEQLGESWGPLAPVLGTMQVGMEGMALMFGPLVDAIGGAGGRRFAQVEKQKRMGVDPDNPTPDEELMNMAKQFGTSAYWRVMQKDNPEQYQEYLDMAGGDEVMAFGFFAADAENTGVMEGQLEEIFGALRAERDAAIDEALDDRDYRADSYVMDILSWWGRQVPLRLATGLAVFANSFAGGEDPIWENGWKNAWGELWRQVEESDRTPSRELGIEGTLAGLVVDLTGGLVCDPTVYIFGPRLKGAIGSVRSAAEVGRFMGSVALKRVRSDLVRFARSSSAGLRELRTLGGEWLGDVGEFAPFLEAAGAVEQRVFNNPWMHSRLGMVAKETEIGTVLNLLDDVQRAELAAYMADTKLAEAATHAEFGVARKGINSPIVILFDRQTGRAAVSIEGATLHDLAAYQHLGAGKVPVVIKGVDKIPGRSPGVDVTSLLVKGERISKVRSSQIRSGTGIGDGKSEYFSPLSLLPKRLVYGENAEQIEAAVDQVIERALLKGATLPSVAYSLSSIMHVGRLRQLLHSTPVGRWLDRYLTPQFERTTIEATGIGAERQQMDTITRMWGARDAVQEEYWFNRLFASRRNAARQEGLYLQELRTLDPLRAEIRALRDELGSSVSKERAAQIEQELAQANQAYAEALGRAAGERQAAAQAAPAVTPAAAVPAVEPAPVTALTPEAEVRLYLHQADEFADAMSLGGDEGYPVANLPEDPGASSWQQLFDNFRRGDFEHDVPLTNRQIAEIMKRVVEHQYGRATKWVIPAGIDDLPTNIAEIAAERAPAARPAAAPAVVPGVVHSGGATGADTAFEEAATKAGYKVQAHSFAGHNITSPNAVRHTAEELAAADAALKKANQTLGRRFPTSSKYTTNLLRRNYFQVKDSDQVIAVSRFENGQVKGGTAWATQMAIDMKKPVFVFDQEAGKWFTWKDNAWVECQRPTISTEFAGIGSRDLSPAGRAEIEALFAEKPAAPAAAEIPEEMLSLMDADAIQDYGPTVQEGIAIARERVLKAQDELGISALSDEQLVDGALEALEYVDTAAVNHTGYMENVRNQIGAFDAYKWEMLQRARRDPAAAARLQQLADEAFARSHFSRLGGYTVNEFLPREVTEIASRSSARPPWMKAAQDRRTAAQDAWNSHLTARDASRARLSALEDELLTSQVKMRSRYELRDTNELQGLFDEMQDDFNRRYIARSYQDADGAWHSRGGPWKDYMDPTTGLVPWEVIKSGQYRIGGNLKTWIKENIGATGHIEGQPWGYGGHATAGMEKERGRQFLNTAVREREKARTRRDPEYIFKGLSYTADSPMSIELQVSPLQMMFASELSGASYIKAVQRLQLYQIREAAWMFQRWWVIDKVMRPATAMTISLDELWRAFHYAGLRGVDRWVRDRALFFEARARAFAQHGFKGRGLHTTLAGKGSQYLSAAKQERLRVLGDFPAMYKRAERQAYEGYGVGFADIHPGEVGYVDACRGSMGMLLQDSGFRAFLKGEDAFRDWWFSEANTRMSKATVVGGDGSFKVFKDWKQAYNGWRYLFDDVLMRTAKQAGKYSDVRSAFVDLASRIDATGGARLFELPTWVTEYMGPIRGVRMATPKNWAGSGGRLGTKHVQELFFEKFFMDPTNYRRGFIQDLTRQAETARLRKLFESQGKTVIPDFELESRLSLQGVHGAMAGPLGNALQDYAWENGFVTEGRIAKLAEERAAQEVQNIMYVWDMGSRAGSQARAIWPFGRPWADMVGFWGRETLRRPALRGWINDINFAHIGDIANAIVDHIPFNPKAASFASRLAATDFTIDSIAPGVPLPGGIESLDFSPLFFLPTGGENPFQSLIPGFGPLPLWLMDQFLNGADPLKDPVEYQKRMDLIATVVPSIAYQRGGIVPRILGGGTTETALSILADVGTSIFNAPYYTLTNAIGDISMETGRNRAVSALLSEQDELDILLSAGSTEEFELLAKALETRANDAAGGLHAVSKAMRWFFPARITVDYGTDEIYDIWLAAGDKFPELLPSGAADPLGLTEHEDKIAMGSDIRRIFFEQPTWKRDLMIATYPQLAINLISSWKWTDVAIAQIPDAARSTYRIGSSEEDLARHNEYVERGYVRPIQPSEKILHVIGMIQAARHDAPKHLYTSVVDDVNEYLWNSVVTPDTKAMLEQFVNTEFGQEYHVTSARQLWQMWGSLEPELEAMWAEYAGIHPEVDVDAWDSLRSAANVPENEQAWSTSWPGYTASNRFSNELTIYSLNEQGREIASALGIEFRPGMTGAELFDQLTPMIADTGGYAMQNAEVTYRDYTDMRQSEQDVAMTQLRRLAYRQEFREETDVQRSIQAFLIMQDNIRREAADRGLMLPSEARQVRQEFAKLEELCAGVGTDFNLMWEDGFLRTFGARNFEEDLPMPPESPLLPDGNLGPRTEQPYITEIVDGDTIGVRRSAGITTEPFLGMQFTREEGQGPEEYNVRLLGVRARELLAEGGLEDAQRLRSALRRAYDQGLPVYLVRDPRFGNVDYYGRQLAWLFIGDQPFYFRDELESAILNGWR